MEIKQKKGISLIVLVITIVVMIILATVVILSLDSSNIIERANAAKEASNLANLKEAANVALTEYQLDVSLGNVDENEVSANDYVKNKLEEQGMDTSTMIVTEDNKILAGLTPVAVQFIEAKVPVGTYISGYDLSSNSKTKYTTSGNEFTCPMGNEGNPTPQEVSRVSGAIWRYIGVSKTGKALIALEIVDGLPKMELGGIGGYTNGPKELDNVCKALYSSDMGTARSIDFDDVVNALEYTGKVGPYTSKDGTTKYLDEKKTIGELVAEGEKALTITAPDGSDVNDLYVEGGSIIGTDANIKGGSLAKDAIFTEATYWLASHHNIVDFKGNYIEFCMQLIMGNSNLCTITMLYSGGSYVSEAIVRPVVELAPNVKISYSGVSGSGVRLSK